jgi:hypothetical protein
MRYMIMFKADSDTEDDAPACIQLAEMGTFIDQLKRDGILLATEGLHPSKRGAARVQVTGGKMTVMDGPFTEAKELVAGFALVDVPSKADAVELAGQFLRVAGWGTSEVREVFEYADRPAN